MKSNTQHTVQEALTIGLYIQNMQLQFLVLISFSMKKNSLSFHTIGMSKHHCSILNNSKRWSLYIEICVCACARTCMQREIRYRKHDQEWDTWKMITQRNNRYLTWLPSDGITWCTIHWESTTPIFSCAGCSSKYKLWEGFDSKDTKGHQKLAYAKCKVGKT